MLIYSTLLNFIPKCSSTTPWSINLAYYGGKSGFSNKKKKKKKKRRNFSQAEGVLMSWNYAAGKDINSIVHLPWTFNYYESVASSAIRHK